jgi:hypothetical protein
MLSAPASQPVTLQQPVDPLHLLNEFALATVAWMAHDEDLFRVRDLVN